MRRLDAEIRGLFGLDHEFIDHDLSLGTRIKTHGKKTDVVKSAAQIVRDIGFGIKDATATKQIPSPNNVLRNGIQNEDSL